MEKRGVMTAIEIQEELGKELTEAAVLRALHGLWASLRVIPLYQSGDQETLWEPMQSRHQQAMSSGVGMSQVTALSVLASVYLQSVVAASSDDAESFLSPLASRSKVREVIRGLTATRQLAMIQMETQSLLYVEGSLPEFPEEAKPIGEAAKPARRPHPTSPDAMEAALKRSVAGSTPRPPYKRPAEGAGGGSATRPSARGGAGSFRPAAGARPDARQREGGSSFRPAAGGARPAYKPRTAAPVERSEPGTGLRADGSPKKPRWRDMPGGRPDQKGKPARFGPRKTEGAPGEDAPRPAAGRDAGAFRPAASSRPAAGGSASSRKPSFGKSFSGKSFSPREGRPARPSAERPSYGGTSSRDSGSREGAREGGRPPARPLNTGRPPIRSSGGRSGSRPPTRTGADRFPARPEGTRPPFRPRREDGASPARPPREGTSSGDRKFTPRPPRAGGFSSARPSSGGTRPYSPRSAGSSTGRPPTGRPAAGPRATGSSSYGRSSATGRPSTGRPSAGRPSTGRPPIGGGPSRSGFKPGGVRTGTGSRPSFGGGSRPGTGRPGASRPPSGRPSSNTGRPASSGRPKTGFGAKPGGRPPAKFKKRPE